MKNNETVKKILIKFLVVVLAVSMYGCKGNSTDKEYDGYYVYYINKQKTKLVSERYTPKKTSQDGLIKEFLSKLKHNGKNGAKKAISKSAGVNSYNLTDGILTIDFDKTYGKKNRSTETLSRAAIVLTFIQMGEVDYVAFTVDGKPLARSDGSAVGNMQATDFVDSLGRENNIYNKTTFSIYYANEDGTKLKKSEFTEDYYGDISKEQLIVNKLLEGPKEEGYTRTISKKTTLVSVMTTGNICYVNFGDNFLTEQHGVSDRLVIFSIVDSLVELNYINKVQICVNGDTNIKFHDISLSDAFIRELDYIEME